jgi:rSAM/selenodomain-associated transferase 1
MKGCLVITAKAPVAGEVKTRLVPPLSFEVAARFYQCCLEDTVEKVSRLSGIGGALAYTPPEGRAYFERWVSERFLLFPQEGEDLGARMLGCFERCQREGARRIALFGADIPHVPPSLLQRGFELLGEADLVLGPTMDGGYYFIGAKAPHPPLFQGMAWGGPGVFEETWDRARRLGLRVRQIEAMNDIDTATDLRRLDRLLSRAPQDLAPRTRRFLLEEMAGVL